MSKYQEQTIWDRDIFKKHNYNHHQSFFVLVWRDPNWRVFLWKTTSDAWSWGSTQAFLAQETVHAVVVRLAANRCKQRRLMQSTSFVAFETFAALGYPRALAGQLGLGPPTPFEQA